VFLKSATGWPRASAKH